MLHSKSEAAWLLSCEKLFRDYSPIYFWTFTFSEVLNDWIYPRRWQGFVHDLVWTIYGGRLAGLRVLEVHKDHGLHYHALLNRRLYVRLARKIGHRYGIGRIHVMKADIGAAAYLSKYLDKDRFTTATRIARWHSVGSFNAIHKNDIEVISPFNSAVQEAIEASPTKRLTYATYCQLYVQHYDLLCPQNTRSGLLHPLTIGPDPKSLSPSELDAIWPEFPEPELNTSTDASSPSPIFLGNDLSKSKNLETGASPTPTAKSYSLNPLRIFTPTHPVSI